MWDNVSIGSGIVSAVFYPVQFIRRYLVEVYHFADDVVGCLLLGKQESAAGYAVFQGDGAYCYRAVFMNNLWPFSAEGMKFYVEAYAMTKEVQPRAHQFLQFFVCMDVQCGCASQQCECGDESDNSETVVTVQVADENVVQPTEFQS